MTENIRQGYFVNLIRWVTETFKKETKDEMTRNTPPLEVGFGSKNKTKKRILRNSKC